MTTPKLQQWLYIQLSAIDRTTGVTNTYYLSNRPILNDINIGRYLPILKYVGEFGAEQGEYLPNPIYSDIVIDISPGSYGYERRFLDILERENIINQSIKLYYAESEIEDLNASSDFVQAWAAKVLSYTKNGNELAIRITSVSIPNRTLGKLITPVAHPSGLPFRQESLGQYLPIIFGSDVEVKPVNVSPLTVSADFAYASTLSNQYVNEGVQAYYARNSEGKYVQVASATNTTTRVAGNGGTLNATNTGVRVGAAGAGSGESLAPLGTLSNGYIVTRILVNLYHDSTAATSEKLTFTLYEAYDNTGLGRKVLYEFKVDATTGAGAKAYYTIICPSDKPIIIEEGKNYYLGINTDTIASVWYWGSQLADTGSYSLKPTDTGAGDDAMWIPLTNLKLIFDVLGAVFTDNGSGLISTDTSGYNFSYVAITQNTATDPTTDLSGLDMVFIVDGLNDSSSGTITGAAYQLIDNAQHVIELLDKEWNGSTWTGGRFDFSRHSSTHTEVTTTTSKYYRKISGATQGRAVLRDVYQEICRNSGCKISLYNGSSSQLCLWAWGSTQSSVATITDEDIISGLNINCPGLETVINRVSFVYAKSIVNSNQYSFINTGALLNYSGTIEWRHGDSSYLTWLLSQSVTTYGENFIKNINFDYLGDSSSAEAMANFIARTYRTAHTTASFSLPYSKWKALDLLDIITIISPELPSYFGTSANASYPAYATAALDFVNGDYWKRASHYRAQIISRKVSFSSNEPPKLNMRVRLLVDHPVDPT